MADDKNKELSPSDNDLNENIMSFSAISEKIRKNDSERDYSMHTMNTLSKPPLHRFDRFTFYLIFYTLHLKNNNYKYSDDHMMSLLTLNVQ